MSDTQVIKKTYIGQIPTREIGLAIDAAQASGFVVEGTYGAGIYDDVTPSDKQIIVDDGNCGVVLSHSENQNPTTFWNKFDELRGASSASKETE